MAVDPLPPASAPPARRASPSRDAPDLTRLRRFVVAFGDLVEKGLPELDLLIQGAALLGELVERDDWLPAAYAKPDPLGYRQRLLHCDSQARFSVVCFVWGPGQATPIHNHTVWGLVGVLRGGETSQRYELTATGGLRPSGPPAVLAPGDVDILSADTGDIHRAANTYRGRTSVSIHVYGANIAAVERSVFELDGASRRFRSSYDNASLPNIWAPQSAVAASPRTSS